MKLQAAGFFSFLSVMLTTNMCVRHLTNFCHIHLQSLCWGHLLACCLHLHLSFIISCASLRSIVLSYSNHLLQCLCPLFTPGRASIRCFTYKTRSSRTVTYVTHQFMNLWEQPTSCHLVRHTGTFIWRGWGIPVRPQGSWREIRAKWIASIIYTH